MAKMLAVLGPVVAAGGALILIVDAIRNWVRWTDLVEWPIQRFRTAAASHRTMLKRIQDYPPTYPEVQRREELVDCNIEYASAI